MIKSSKQIEEYTLKLKTIIKTAEFAGNTTVIDDYNDRILKLKEKLLELEYSQRTCKEWKRLDEDCPYYNSIPSKHNEILY